MSILEGYVEGMINLEGGGGGTSDYAALQNKPSINNVTLEGNKTTEDLNISYDDLQNKPTIRNMPNSSGAAAGDVLTHTSTGDQWQPPVEELPAYTSENEKYLKVVNGDLEWAEVSGGVNYSSEEKVIGTWINGKPIYQKAFEKQVTNVSAGGLVDITAEIPITCTIKDSTVAFDYNYEGKEYALVNSPSVYYNRSGNGHYIRFSMGSGTISGKITMIAVYTKTTD